MPTRRTTIATIATGATIGVAGCGGSTDNQEEEEPEPEENETQEEEPEEASFEITDVIGEGEFTFSEHSEQDLGVVVENTGGSSTTQSIQIKRDEETINEEELELEPGEEYEVLIEPDTEYDSGYRYQGFVEYEYAFSTEDDEATINRDVNPTDGELLEILIDKAEEHYNRALEIYAEQIDTEDATILHAYPSTPQIERDDDAEDQMSEAGDILFDHARDYAETQDQRRKVSEYRTYDDIISNLRRNHNDIHKSYTAIGPAEGNSAYNRDELDSAIESQEEMREEIEDNEMYMEILETLFDVTDWKIGLMEDMYNGLENVAGASEFVLVAPTALQLAREDFNSVIEELEDTESAPPEDHTDEDLLELAEDYYEAVDEALRDITQA